MPVVCCAAPPAAIRQEKRSMRVDYVRRSGGEFAETSKADNKAVATKRKKAKAVDRRVPAACWGMFKAYLGAEGEKFGKQEPTLADLIQLVIEGAGGVIDTTNWVAYHVSQHLPPC